MSSSKPHLPVPTYFLSPTRNNPPNGLIKLGNIIRSPELPDEPLELATPIPVPNASGPHDESGWHWSAGSNRTISGTIGASFLEFFLGAGGDVGASWIKENEQEWNCQKISTFEFAPTTSWLESVVADPKVHAKLVRLKFWERKFYVVVGIKIAYGASMATRFARATGLHLHTNVDLTAVTGGVPVVVNGGTDLDQGRHWDEQVENIDDFVIGYRLREIKLSRKLDVKKNEQYNHGTAFREDTEGKKEQEDVAIFVEGIEDQDAQASDFRMQADLVKDQQDTQEYVCVKTGVQVALQKA